VEFFYEIIMDYATLNKMDGRILRLCCCRQWWSGL